MQNLENKIEPRWDDFRVPINSIKAGLVNPPTFTKWKDDGAGSTGVFLYWFEPTKTNSIFFVAQLPHERIYGSDLHPHIHWVTDSATANNTVWEFEYNWSNIHESFSANTTIDTKTFTTNVDNDKHMLSEFSVIDGTGKSLSSMLSCRISRMGADAADTFVGNIGLLEFDFHYQIDDLGSRLEHIKN